MDESSLAEAIQRPEVQRKLLGTYRGAFSLGVTSSPHDDKKPALLLRVEGEASEEIPSHIAVDGEEVPVVVKGGFKRPKPL